MLASRASRTTDAQAPEFLYAMRFREEHGWVHAPTLTHDGRAVRVHLPDVYVSLSAETDMSRAEREARELERRLRRDRAGSNPGNRAAQGGEGPAPSATMHVYLEEPVLLDKSSNSFL